MGYRQPACDNASNAADAWGTQTDSATSAADAWGTPAATPQDAPAADWLNSAPAPAPEHFTILDPFHKTLIPLDSWVTQGIDWVVVHFRPLFQGIRVPVDYILNAFQQLLLGMPAPVAIILFALIAWQISSLGMGVATLISLIAIGAIGAWSQAMITPGAGIDRVAVLYRHWPADGDLAGAQSRRRESDSSTAGCDADHTRVRLSGANRDAVWYRQCAGRGGDHYLRAPASGRLTILGINQVPADLIEASRSFGPARVRCCLKFSCRWQCPPSWRASTRR
ncbi:glycine betaine/L-proline ABC transporter permease [Atlantibacter hermannii]|nr:glycine betaine/L-proline ABC transporter permease [Atlantibacter hermannii]